MNIVQSVRIALEMLRLHKLRAFLTMFGVIIGVMSVTIIVMISSGFQAYIGNEFKKLGSDTMYVFFDPGRNERDTAGGVDGLKIGDVAYLQNRVASLDMLVPLIQVPQQKVSYLDKSIDNPRIYATDQNYIELNRIPVIEGRYFSQEDIVNRANVCVVGEAYGSRLFGGKSPVGKYIDFSGITLQVIGVFEKNNFMGDGNERDVLLPYTTAQDKWVGGDNLMMIMTRPKAGYPIDKAMQETWEALMLKTNNKPIYRVDSNESILGVFGRVFGVAGSVLAAIAALSLLVGGIGIMNIMLVSVTERTKEIGLRKAVGAKRNSILVQFVVEAATLSLIGGLIGMGIAWGLGQIVNVVSVRFEWPNKEGLPTPFPIVAGIGAAIFSALIGVIFGLYPAVSAAKLDPIVALRRE